MKDEIWRAKIRALTAALGAAGEAVYNEIEAAVEDRIEQSRDDGWRAGYSQGQVQTYGVDY